MSEPRALSSWQGRSLFVVLSLLILFFRLLPLNTEPPNLWVPPDLLLVLTLVWVIRRPENAGLVTIALLFLLADILFQRPIGLFAALVVLASEMLRARLSRLREAPFWLEWLTIAFALWALTFANRILGLIFVVPQPPFAATMIQMAANILVYPLVVFIAYIGFGLRRPAVGEVNALGQKL